MNWLPENTLLEEDRRDDRRGGRRGKQLPDELKETKKTTGTRKSRHSIELCGEIILQVAMDLSQDRLRYEYAIYKGCCWPHNTTWQTTGCKPRVSKVGTKVVKW
jgi:hypothetical protein